jgi:hypothetical protein
MLPHNYTDNRTIANPANQPIRPLLASNADLVEELFKRATFFGVLVSLEGEVLGNRPKLGATVAVRKTAKLSNLGAAMMLNQAAGNVLREAAKD